jgi:hypothetical protein
LNVRLTAHIQTAATKVINREYGRAFVRLVYLKQKISEKQPLFSEINVLF